MQFDRVYDYVAGKDDWRSAGFPIEGHLAEHNIPVANDVVTREVPTCRETDRLRSVKGSANGGNASGCLVLVGEDIVLGRVTERAFDHPEDTPVAQVMDPGPATFRPGTPLEEIVERMQNAKVDDVLVTTAEGSLVGVLYRKDAERELARATAQHSEPG